jgi:Uma2 family endonuclease
MVRIPRQSRNQRCACLGGRSIVPWYRSKGEWIGSDTRCAPADTLVAMPAERSYVPRMTPPLMTAEELLAAHIPDKRTELVRGVLRVREPAGDRHGRVAMNLAIRLGVYVEQGGLGQLFAAETGFTLSRMPDTVRAPDIAFVRRQRLPEATRGFLELAPDLVVEVLSPSDRPGETLAKVGDWLEAGAALIWVIDPERRLARIYRADGTESLLEGDDALQGEDVLPAFSCPLAAIL